MGSCGSLEGDAKCLLRRYDCCLGDCFVCVSCVRVGVAEVLYEPPKFGGLSLV